MNFLKRWFKKYSNPKDLQKSWQIRHLKSYLKDDCYRSYKCEYVARGVAAGLAGAVVPGFQLFYAAILVIILRGNIIIALLLTFITNPITVIPIMYFIYFVGSIILGEEKKEFVFQEFSWDFSSFHAFWSNFTTWALQFGKAFLVGVPVVSFVLGIIGYFGTILIWKSVVFFSKK